MGLRPTNSDENHVGRAILPNAAYFSHGFAICIRLWRGPRADPRADPWADPLVRTVPVDPLFANEINWVWLLYDDAEVAENQQNTRIDGCG
jgi:hypothetical protein